jgi:hypothetical protein
MLDKGCYRGVMIWAINQDTPDFQALLGLLGDEFVSKSMIKGGDLSNTEKEKIVEEIGGLTDDTCYVALGYVLREPTIEGSPDCRPRDITMSTVHSPSESAYELYGALAQNAQTCGPF